MCNAGLGELHIEKCVTGASKRMFLTFKTGNCQLSIAIYQVSKKTFLRNRLKVNCTNNPTSFCNLQINLSPQYRGIVTLFDNLVYKKLGVFTSTEFQY